MLFNYTVKTQNKEFHFKAKSHIEAIYECSKKYKYYTLFYHHIDEYESYLLIVKQVKPWWRFW